MKISEFNTLSAPLHTSPQFWAEKIISTYYDLSVNIQDLNDFSGKLRALSMDDLEISFLQSKPVQYVCRGDSKDYKQDSFLLALPFQNHIGYLCNKQEFIIQPGDFLLQHGLMPYTFNCPDTVSMWVVKISGDKLRQFCWQPEKLCTHTRSYTNSNKSEQINFLKNYLSIVFTQLNSCKNNQQHQFIMTRHLIDLMVLLLSECQSSALHSKEKAVIFANLQRIQQYALKHLSNADLTAQKVADGCQISRRYLHIIFQHEPLSFNQWLKEQRLKHARDLIAAGQYPFSIDFLANQCGFRNASYFSSQFKKRFHVSPKDFLKRA